MSKLKRKLRDYMAERVLEGKTTPQAARNVLTAAGIRYGRKVPGSVTKSVAKSVTKPARAPRAATAWTASELAALAPFADHSDPAMRAIADAKMAERVVV